MRRRFKQAAFLAAALAVSYAPARGDEYSFARVERGRYLAAAGDCQSCHTDRDGKPFAGGRPIETPFGIVYSANITPDRANGIGAWSSDEFYRALHEGLSANGAHLYPAFPYPWYTKVTREDADAIYAYLKTLDPVDNKPPPTALDWPLNYRFVMAGWDKLFFHAGTFKPDSSKSPEWNRGAYLVQSLGHCGACHTPMNVAGASERNSFLRGADLQNWYAPNLTGDLRSGLGNWSKDDIAAFLKTGRNGKTLAYGPMAEVIRYSTSQLSDADLSAIATYLKDIPAPPPQPPPQKPSQQLTRSGEAIYVDACSACHQMNGQGVPGMFPALKGDAMAQSSDPSSMVHLILRGGRAVATDARPTPLAMPAFGWKLSDDEIAAVTSYVRSAWGNAAPAVSADAVHGMRGATRAASQ